MENLSKEFFEWIAQHQCDDVAKLRLKWRGQFSWIDFAILQIECRRKYARKLSDELSYDRFLFPDELSAQQSTSDSVAQFHASLIDNNVRVIDLTCGLGIDAMHFSRKASSVVAIDIDRMKSDVLRHNASTLGLSAVLTAVCCDCRDYIVDAKANSADVVFIDPARRADDGSRLYSIADCHPDVTAITELIARVSPRLVVKLSPMLDVTQTLRELPSTTHLYVVGSANECKEIVADCNLVEGEPDSVIISIVSTDNQYPAFSYTITDESRVSGEIEYALPHKDDYLFEPSAATMKAAPWRLICDRFGLKKLHPNTHLFFADTYRRDFPGAVWIIDDVLDFSSSNIKRFARRWPKINVSTRNFPMTASQLRAKLKVADFNDDSMKVIGVTSQGRQYLLVLKKYTTV